ncbi:MAG: type II secretion system GspH family protein [Planctomycetes bacterium]|jgi:prepilin-type N-terminal cleavage/methylation domain-containing protein|nr:type II secretion system GspH family protein [Planctomycetota bacterium]
MHRRIDGSSVFREDTPRRRNAFTLIELLVVISVIAVLMAIIMPALSKAREGGMATVCKGNMKGYSVALQMYLQDNDDTFLNPWALYFPRTSAYSDEGGNPQNRWCNGAMDLNRFPQRGGPFFQSYLKSAKAYICPTFKRMARAFFDQTHISETVSFANKFGTPALYEPWYNYSMNAYLGPKGQAALDGQFAKAGQVKHPSELVVFVEESCFLDNGINDQGINDTYMRPLPVVDAETAVRSRGNRWAVKPGPAPEGVGVFADIIAGLHHAPSGNPVAGRGTCVFLAGHVEARNRMDTFGLLWPK